MKKPKDIDDYIVNYPIKTREMLEVMRATIRKSAQQAEETISYGMPAFKLGGALVWFAAYSKHIGFYPRGSGIATFKKELSVYKSAKGSVQFPLNKPLPLRLIGKITAFRVKENLARAGTKMKREKAAKANPQD